MKFYLLALKFIEEGDYDDTITGVKVGEELLLSEFLAPTTDAMNQTMTIRSKIEEEKKNRGLESTSRSLISDIKRSNSRPITPTKTNSKIPFMDQYMKSPMRTRDKIPRTPYSNDVDLSRNDFQNDEASNLEHSIVIGKDNFKPPEFGTGRQVQDEEEKVEMKPDPNNDKEPETTPPVTPSEAFIKKDKIPRTPPQLKAKQYAPTPSQDANTTDKDKVDKKKKSKKK